MVHAARLALSRVIQVFDVVVAIFSFGVAMRWSFGAGPVSFSQVLGLRIQLQTVLFFIIFLCVWHFIFTTRGLYGSKRLGSRRAELVDVIKATSAGSVVLVLAAFLLQLRIITPTFALVFWVLATFIAASSRLAIRTWLRRLREHGRDFRNMLIVGSNPRAINFANTIRSRPELGYHIIGFADRHWAGSEELAKHGYSMVSDLDDLPTFLRHKVVDEVVLTLPVRSFHLHSSDLAKLCEEQGILLRLLSDLFDLKTSRVRAEDIGGGSTLITHYGSGEGDWGFVIKRAIDISVSLILLILLSPVLLVTAILIKLTSAGPVLFKQERVGYNKRTFKIFKFRTMVLNAEEKLREIEHLNEVSGPVFKIKNDPRLTPIGKFLRRTSIDELPQFLNVLKGDMSLVGPRPLQMRDYNLFTQDCEDWQRCRFSVRPGITCLWQVSGRSEMPFEKWMELDLQYVRKWSLRLDFEILMRTIPAVFKGSGAA